MNSEHSLHDDLITGTGLNWQPAQEPERPPGLYGLPGVTKAKIAVSVGLDAIDLAIGWVPGVGHAYELVAIAIACAMWGKAGMASAWELIDFTNVLDGFIPTCSLIAWYSVKQEMAA